MYELAQRIRLSWDWKYYITLLWWVPEEQNRGGQLKHYEDTLKASLKPSRINTSEGIVTGGLKGVMLVRLWGAWHRSHLMPSSLAVTVGLQLAPATTHVHPGLGFSLLSMPIKATRSHPSRWWETPSSSPLSEKLCQGWRITELKTTVHVLAKNSVLVHMRAKLQCLHLNTNNPARYNYEKLHLFLYLHRFKLIKLIKLALL